MKTVGLDSVLLSPARRGVHSGGHACMSPYPLGATMPWICQWSVDQKNQRPTPGDTQGTCVWLSDLVTAGIHFHPARTSKHG